MKLKGIIIGSLAVIIVAASVALPISAASSSADLLKTNLSTPTALSAVSTAPPALKKPDWYYKTTVTYSVTSKGSVKGDLSEFATQANETLNDARGWSQLGAKFVQVDSGGSFKLILTEAALVPSFSPTACTVDWSCTVGNNVIINDDRWTGASAAWNSAGGSLRDYRHMVINHETGHWLGHGHEFCSGAGQLAPVMQQQSIDLQGCKFNPWPLPSELWTKRF